MLDYCGGEVSLINSYLAYNIFHYTFNMLKHSSMTTLLQLDVCDQCSNTYQFWKLSFNNSHFSTLAQ